MMFFSSADVPQRLESISQSLETLEKKVTEKIKGNQGTDVLQSFIQNKKILIESRKLPSIVAKEL